MTNQLRHTLHRLLTGSAAIAMVASCTTAQSEAPPAKEQETQQSDSAVTQQGMAEAQDLLVAMDNAGKDFQTLAAEVRLTERDSLTGEDVQRAGRFWLSREDGTRFHVIFYGIVADVDGKEQLKPEKTEYLLTGDTLIERIHRTKTQMTRRLDSAQVDRDLLKLGEGPFPLPIGQSPAEVRKQFNVTHVDPGEVDEDDGDVPIYDGTKRLRLIPKDQSPLAEDFAWVEIDVEPDTGRPRQVITLDAGGENMKITKLLKIEIDPDLDPAVFELEKIDLSSWNVMAE